MKPIKTIVFVVSKDPNGSDFTCAANINPEDIVGQPKHAEVTVRGPSWEIALANARQAVKRLTMGHRGPGPSA